MRSAGGIGFAVLLMLMQLGFEQAFFDSSLEVIRGLDGDILIQSAHKYQFATRDPFPRSDLDIARKVPGVASARALYADWFDFFWKNPSDGKVFLVRAFGFDPDAPVFRYADVNANREKLKDPNTVLVDRRARHFLGMDGGATEAEINGTKVKIVGNFALGPDFQSDGTVIMSERTFTNLLRGPAGNPSSIDLGVLKVDAGQDPAAVQQALKKALPDTIAVLTKPELIEFGAQVSSGCIICGTDFCDGHDRRLCRRDADLVSGDVHRPFRPITAICNIEGDGISNRLSAARRARTGRLQCLCRVDPGMAAEPPALLHYWAARIITAAYDCECDALSALA